MKYLFEGDCLEFLKMYHMHIRAGAAEPLPLIIADPPDNLGLEYNGFTDRNSDYYGWLDSLIRSSLEVTNCFWLSYYWKHDLQIKSAVERLLRTERRSTTAKTIIWRYTFGQYVDSDFGSGFRFLLRLTKPSAKFRPESVKIPSRRMEIGDPRAKGPRVPDDVWEFPRVVGNSTERCAWHPTQHPEQLYRRIIHMHTDPGDTVLDLFAGTGTLFRTAGSRKAIGCEISPAYCKHLKQEHPDLEIIQ